MADYMGEAMSWHDWGHLGVILGAFAVGWVLGRETERREQGRGGNGAGRGDPDHGHGDAGDVGVGAVEGQRGEKGGFEGPG